MKILYEKTKYFTFAFDFSFNQEILAFCRSLKDIYGWQNFSWNEGKWRFSDPSIIFMIKNKYPEIKMEEKVSEEIKKAENSLQESIVIEEEANRLKEATESNLEIKGIKGDLREYQKIGVEFFLNSKGRALLADDMGTGKTLQSLAYLARAGHRRTLIVCPASVKFSWENEVEKWTVLKSYVVDSKTDFSDIPFETEVVIINYDILKKHLPLLMGIPWDCLIGDEAAGLKNKDSQRSKAFRMISKNINSVLLLTGTPLLNRPIELFHLLHILDPIVWSDYWHFCRRYCDGKQGYWGFEAKGATNLDELRQKISRYFLRRTKDEILTELPPKNRIDLPVKLDGQSKENYDKVSREFVKYLRENKGKKDKEILKSLNAEKLVKINYLREISAMGKLAAVRELIDSILESDQKVLVFCSFNEPLRVLRDEYPDSVIILGETDVKDRGTLVKKFQEDPKCKVFFGGFKSAGVGITLTAASNVILIDFPWTPADREQAIDRAHRIGNTADSINIYQIISRGTIDEFLIKLLRKKQAVFDVVIDADRKEDEEEGSVEELIKMIESANS